MLNIHSDSKILSGILNSEKELSRKWEQIWVSGIMELLFLLMSCIVKCVTDSGVAERGLQQAAV